LKSILRAMFGDLGNQFPIARCTLKPLSLYCDNILLDRNANSEVGALITVEGWANSDRPVGST
jgi:hypothetical protein